MASVLPSKMASCNGRRLWHVYRRFSFRKINAVNAEFPLHSFTKVSNIRTYCDRATSQWQLLSAVALERKPVITADLVPIERDVKEVFGKIEFEKSLLSDHELRHIEDVKKLEKLKKSSEFLEDESELGTVSLQTAEDFEDACEEELKQFKLAPRKTKADEVNDCRSIQRLLDSSLLFVVQQKLGDRFHWILPEGPRAEGESMRQAAERVLREVCGDDVKALFMGNAPVGYYKYKYPQKARTNGIVGAKIFFFKAQLLQNTFEIAKTENIKDYAWLHQEEWQELFHKRYQRSVKAFMFYDKPVDFEYSGIPNIPKYKTSEEAVTRHQ